MRKLAFAIIDYSVSDTASRSRIGIAHQTHIIVDTCGVALGAYSKVVPIRHVCESAEIVGLLVTPLGSGAVNCCFKSNLSISSLIIFLTSDNALRYSAND